MHVSKGVLALLAGVSLLAGIALDRMILSPASPSGEPVMADAAASSADLGAVFDAHVAHEFVDRDVEATMKTMVAEPYVHNVATLWSGIGGRGVREFYTDYFVGKMPADSKVERISRTVGENQVVDELILSFTHDVPIEFMLPGVPPTGKYVELPHVVVMKFEGGKVAHEHIYWDQASLLVQVGLLDRAKAPGAKGVEQAGRLRELARSRSQ